MGDGAQRNTRQKSGHNLANSFFSESCEADCWFDATASLVNTVRVTLLSTSRKNAIVISVAICVSSILNVVCVLRVTSVCGMLELAALG